LGGMVCGERVRCRVRSGALWGRVCGGVVFVRGRGVGVADGDEGVCLVGVQGGSSWAPRGHLSEQGAFSGRGRSLVVVPYTTFCLGSVQSCGLGKNDKYG